MLVVCRAGAYDGIVREFPDEIAQRLLANGSAAPAPSNSRAGEWVGADLEEAVETAVATGPPETAVRRKRGRPRKMRPSDGE